MSQKPKSIPSIALFMQGVRHYERELLRGISDFANLHGPWRFYRNVSYLCGNDVNEEIMIRRWMPDAMIVRETTPHRFHRILEHGIPVIYSPTTEHLPGMANIVVNDRRVGRLAAGHLRENGLRQFGYCGVDTFFWSREREQGFSRALSEFGAEVHVFHSQQGDEYFGWNASHRKLLDWLMALPKPVGLFCCTDDFTLLVQEACEEAGLCVPDDVALLGVGNDESICQMARVSLSSVQLNIRRGGYEAAERLAQMLRSRKLTRGKSTNIVIEPVGIVARQSTDAAAAQDREVAKAISFIRDHVNLRMDVNDVVSEVNLSRRSLYDRFRLATGKNLYAYIRDRKLEHFARQLVETNRTVSEIAYGMGYDSNTNVARLFKKHYGITPVAYRKAHACSTAQSDEMIS